MIKFWSYKNEYLSMLGLGGIVIKGLDQYSSDSIVFSYNGICRYMPTSDED